MHAAGPESSFWKCKMARKIAILAAIAQNDSIRLECSIFVNLSIKSEKMNKKAKQPVVCWFSSHYCNEVHGLPSAVSTNLLPVLIPWFSVHYATSLSSLLYLHTKNNAQHRQIRCESAATSDNVEPYSTDMFYAVSDELKFSHDWL